MASPCRADPPEDEELVAQHVPAAPQAVPDPPQIEHDFVEEPSLDFFCPVTLELLTEPQQTTCCGNHLSQEAAQRLQRDGKPCPMCKVPQLATTEDKFYKRKVNELKVRCPHKKSGCEWVGGVNEVKQHSQSCPKRPWQCQYCPFVSTYDIGVSKHVPKCTQYPVVCPNCCEVGTVPRCEVEAHLMVCPLEPVACEYAEVGCDVKVPRRDLARHMEEGQQQHLLSATLLNLQLTRENTEEKNRLLRVIEEIDRKLEERDAECGRKLKEKETVYSRELAAKDQHIKERDEKIKEKDETIAKKDEAIADLQKQLKQMQDGLEAKVTNLQRQVVKYGEDTQQHLTQHDKHIECVSLRFRHLQGFTLHEFTLPEFSKWQAKGDWGDWYSEPFYSHPGGYKFQLNICTNGFGSAHGVCMSVMFKLVYGDHDDKLEWPITHTAHVQLLNQLGDHGHIEKTSTNRWSKGERGHRGGLSAEFIKLTELGLNADKNTHYLKNDTPLSSLL